MIKIDEIIFQVLTSDESLKQLVGSYQSGDNTIYKFFSALPTLKEGAKADFPIVVYNYAYQEVPLKVSSFKQYDVIVETHAIHKVDTGAMDIAIALTTLLHDYRNNNINGVSVQRITLQQQQMIQYDADEALEVWFVPQIYRMRINVR